MNLDESKELLQQAVSLAELARGERKRRTKSQMQADEQAHLALTDGIPTTEVYLRAREALLSAYNLPAAEPVPVPEEKVPEYNVASEGSPSLEDLPKVASQAMDQMAEVEVVLASAGTVNWSGWPASALAARARVVGKLAEARTLLSGTGAGRTPDDVRCDLAGRALTASRVAFTLSTDVHRELEGQ